VIEPHECEWKERAQTLEVRLVEMQAQLEALKRAVFGKKSERQPAPAKLTPPADPEHSKQKRKDHAEALKAVPELRIEHPVPDELKACPKCGGEASRPLPPKTSEQWEYVPGHFERRVHVRHVLACGCGEHIVTAPAPAKVIDRGKYGPGLCAHAVVSKCADAIPLHRLAKAFARAGVPVSDRTLGELFHLSAELLTPIYDTLMQKIAADEVVQADETPLQVQALGKTKRAYVWTFLSGDRIGYRFSPGRSGQTPLSVLGGTNGTLVVDAYTGYNATCTPDQRERAGCLAHVRRKFHDAQSSAPEAAAEAMRLILEVYRVEHEAKRLGIVRGPAHRELRQTAGKAAMARLHDWLVAQREQHLPKSPMGQAIGYALGQWPSLQVFLENPAVPIDNNASERALRIVALGRKNFLFVGNDVAGQNLAVLLSLVRTCEAVGVNPQAYLTDVLMRVQDWPATRVAELLPECWAAA
jgi:transposase